MPSTPPHITTSKSGCTAEPPPLLLLLLLLEGLVLAAAAEAAAAAAVAESRCWSPAGRGATPKLGLRRILLLLLWMLLLWMLLLLLGVLRAGSSEAKGWLLVVMTVGPFLCGSCFCCFMAC
jgi:hypothetical protein